MDGGDGTLKVEARVQIPLGLLRAKVLVSGVSRWRTVGDVRLIAAVLSAAQQACLIEGSPMIQLRGSWWRVVVQAGNSDRHKSPSPDSPPIDGGIPPLRTTAGRFATRETIGGQRQQIRTADGAPASPQSRCSGCPFCLRLALIGTRRGTV
jgi:hypothetical protein